MPGTQQAFLPDKPYTIVIPPPNVTGMLHMGHMLNNTLQDVLIRRARMSGKNACWAVDLAFLVKVAEYLDDALGAGFVHREAGARGESRGDAA